MADYDELRKRREREEKRAEEDREAAEEKARRSGPGRKESIHQDPLLSADAPHTTEKFLELLKRAEPMLEQINNLYSQYVAGVERTPPIERRKQLDQIMAMLRATGKFTPATQFRYGALVASYASYRERWDRVIRGMESGGGGGKSSG